MSSDRLPRGHPYRAPIAIADQTSSRAEVCMDILANSERVWSQREKMIKIVMSVSPIVTALQLVENGTSLPLAFTVLFLSYGTVVGGRSLVVSSEINLLKELRKKISQYSTYQDFEEYVQTPAKRLECSINDNGGATLLPFVIPSLMVLVLVFYSETMPIVNLNLVFWVSAIAALIVRYYAKEIDKNVARVRGDVFMLLEPEENYDTRTSVRIRPGSETLPPGEVLPSALQFRRTRSARSR